MIFSYFVQHFDVFLFGGFRHGYLKKECPVLTATPTMAAFLDYDFLPTREKVFVSEDFHTVLGLPLDSEENETAPYYSDYIDDSTPLETWESVSYVSTLPTVNMNQDNINYTEPSTTTDMYTERDLIPHYTTSSSTQDIENNHVIVFGGNSTSLSTEENQMSSFTTSSALVV